MRERKKGEVKLDFEFEYNAYEIKEIYSAADGKKFLRVSVLLPGLAQVKHITEFFKRCIKSREKQGAKK